MKFAKFVETPFSQSSTGRLLLIRHTKKVGPRPWGGILSWDLGVGLWDVTLGWGLGV